MVKEEERTPVCQLGLWAPASRISASITYVFTNLIVVALQNGHADGVLALQNCHTGGVVALQSCHAGSVGVLQNGHNRQCSRVTELPDSPQTHSQGGLCNFKVGF